MKKTWAEWEFIGIKPVLGRGSLAQLAKITIFRSNRRVEKVYGFGFKFRNLLNKPVKVFLLCVCIFIITLFFNGAIWRVWGLHHDSATIQKQILNSKSQAKVLDMQIKQAKDPSFIERQAKDKLDFVGEHDLVFVFSDN